MKLAKIIGNTKIAGCPTCGSTPSLIKKSDTNDGRTVLRSFSYQCECETCSTHPATEFYLDEENSKKAWENKFFDMETIDRFPTKKEKNALLYIKKAKKGRVANETV